VVGLGHFGGEDFHEPGGELLLVGCEGAPGGDFGWARGKDGVGGDDAEGFLAGEGLFAVDVPAHVELAFELGDVGLGGLQGRVGRAGGHVEEDGFIGREAFLLKDPGAGVVGEVFGEGVVGGAAGRWVEADGLGAFDELRVPLVGFAVEEAVVVVAALVGGPVVEGAGLRGFGVGDEVPLADAGGGVAVVGEDLGEQRGGARDGGGVAGVSVGPVGDGAHADGVIVASGEERGAGGRAEGFDAEVGVAKALRGELAEGGRGDDAAEGGGLAVAGVVDKDEEDVGGIGGCGEGGCGVEVRGGGGGGDGAVERGWWDGEGGAVYLRLCCECGCGD